MTPQAGSGTLGDHAGERAAAIERMAKAIHKANSHLSMAPWSMIGETPRVAYRQMAEAAYRAEHGEEGNAQPRI